MRCFSIRLRRSPDLGCQGEGGHQGFEGLGSDEREESFDVLVCTPTWLARVVATEGPQVGRHRLIVEKLNLHEAKLFLLRQVERLEAPTWPELAAKLSRLGYWEFEDYRP